MNFGRDKLHNALDCMLDIMCATGDYKALTMKAFNETKNMLQDVIETYFMPNLKDDLISEKCYKLMTAIKEQTKNIIDDFKEEIENG